MTKRQAIETLRDYLKERNADSNYTNQFLYNTLDIEAQWLIKREESAGRIYKNNSLFQNINGLAVQEVSTIPSCLKLKTKCKIYRTVDKLPEMWMDNDGPIIRSVSSVDNSTFFMIISPLQWQNKLNDPYQKYSSERYAIVDDGYLWFSKNPHYINFSGFLKNDAKLFKKSCTECDEEENKDCVRNLDTEYKVPEWIMGELFAQALRKLTTLKQIPEDTQIDKNPNNKQ